MRSVAALTAAVSVAGAAAFASAAGAQAVITEKNLSFAAAKTIAETAIEVCRKNGFRVSVTVVDNSGAVRAAFRDDGTPPHTFDASYRKAFTARTYRITSIEFAKRIANEKERPGLAQVPNTIGLPGGIPIKIGEQTIGAVGVAGAPGGKGDDECAEAGIAKIADELK